MTPFRNVGQFWSCPKPTFCDFDKVYRELTSAIPTKMHLPRHLLVALANKFEFGTFSTNFDKARGFL
jgi:hypothetical protein